MLQMWSELTMSAPIATVGATARTANGRDLERHEQIAHDVALLRRWLKPGDVVLTATLHTSRSGMQHVVGMWAVNLPERRELQAIVNDPGRVRDADKPAQRALDAVECRPRTTRIWAFAARVLKRRADLTHGGVVCHYDAANELVGDLALVLYGDRRALVNEEL